MRRATHTQQEACSESELNSGYYQSQKRCSYTAISLRKSVQPRAMTANVSFPL